MFDVAVVAQQQRRQMSAVRVAQASRAIVELRIEERRVGVVGGVLVEQPVHRLQQPFRFLDRDRALAAQVGLEVGHQQRGGHALAGDVADDETEALLAEVEEVVVVAADAPRLHAGAGVFERSHRGQTLRKEPRLHLHRDLEFVRGPALGRRLLGRGAALRLDRPAHLVEADQRERVPIDDPRTGRTCRPTPSAPPPAPAPSAPPPPRIRRQGLVADAPKPRRVLELHAAPPPLAVHRGQVFGDEHDLRRPADQPGVRRLRRRLDQRQHHAPVRRRHRHGPLPRRDLRVERQPEPERVHVEPDAPLQVPDIDAHGVDAAGTPSVRLQKSLGQY